MKLKLLFIIALIVSAVGIGYVITNNQESSTTEAKNLQVIPINENEVNQEYITPTISTQNIDKPLEITNKKIRVVYKGSNVPLKLDPELSTKEKTVNLPQTTIRPDTAFTLSIEKPDNYYIKSIKLYIEIENKKRYMEVPIRDNS